jgi:L-iditol 2-dehydrogenase
VKVAVYHSNRDIRIEERPVPAVGPGEVLMRIHASGICGSDLMEWYRLPKAPVVLGHEVAGVVEEVGEGVEKYRPGDRVFATHHVPCGECAYCRGGHPSVCDMLRSTSFDPGGFSEYVRVPEINVERGMLHLPDEVSFEDGSFVEPLGCIVRGQNLLGVGPGNTVLVIGSGLAGLLHVQLARARGAETVIAVDVDPFRLDAARSLGADLALDAREDVEEAIRERAGGRLADRVILCTAALPALEQACRCLDRGGRLLLFAIYDPGVEPRLPLQDLWWKEATLLSSYAASGPELEEALERIHAGEVKVGEMITHRLPLEETARGFELVAEAGRSLKVIIEP